MQLDFAAWVARWDAQQARYGADREGRFQVLFDALEAAAGARPGVVVDLACGPGSLGVRLLDRFESARVVGVDIDPVLLALGRGAYGDHERLSFVRADLRAGGWLTALGIDRADAVLSSTALHWLGEDAIRRLYRELSGLVRPAGVFLDADRARPGPDAAGLADVAARMTARYRERRRTAPADAETWEDWWTAVRAEPALAEPLAERDRLGHAALHGRHALTDDDHRRLLREAGFAAADVLWRLGDDRILAALR